MPHIRVVTNCWGADSPLFLEARHELVGPLNTDCPSGAKILGSASDIYNVSTLARGSRLKVWCHILAPVPVLVGFLGSWLVHVGGVFTDSYELLRNFPHLQEHPELVQAVENGSLRLSDLRGRRERQSNGHI
jgi:hypothetical protein